MQYDHHGAAGFRSQWDNVSGGPTSFLINDNHRLWDHHGVGVNYLYDAIGFFEVHSISINYNYQFTFGEDKANQHRLSLGLSPGIYMLRLRPEWVTPSANNDASLPQDFSSSEFNLDLGVAYTWKGLFTGYSMRHLQGIFSKTNANGFTNYQFVGHHYLYGGYCFKPGEKDLFEITPQLLVATDFVKLSFTGQLIVAYSIKDKQRLWLGAGYRASDAIQVMAGVDLYKRFRLGYSYDMLTSKLSTISRGSHEVVLGYYLKSK